MDLVEQIARRLDGRLGLVGRDGGTLRIPTEAPRFGPVQIRVEHDSEAASIRVFVPLTPPSGAGPDFLLWCLAVSAQYFHVKVGLDDEGMLIFHADIEAGEEAGPEWLADTVVERAETILELLDDDLVPFLLGRSLGTAQQRARWQGPFTS